jgi:hypothetical protein
MLVVLALVGVMGLLLLIAAQRFGRPALIGPGLLLFAVGALAAAADAFRTRYVHERSTVGPESVVYEGAAAALFGVVLVVAAIALATAGLAFTLGAEHELYRFLLARPGAALLAAAGGAGVLGAREWRGSSRRLLASLPQRFGAAIMLLGGIALVAIGVFEVVAPAAFDGAIDRILEPLTTAPR